ncbi:MAG: hypothetical protein KDE09_13725 [Anaerolineales bacterium]|nr:hypothetical protein [Anaerolineales bacterium]MCB0029014.1 hypothetical protein [Anaerolineales bacterium]
MNHIPYRLIPLPKGVAITQMAAKLDELRHQSELPEYNLPDIEDVQRLVRTVISDERYDTDDLVQIAHLCWLSHGGTNETEWNHEVARVAAAFLQWGGR